MPGAVNDTYDKRGKIRREINETLEINNFKIIISRPKFHRICAVISYGHSQISTRVQDIFISRQDFLKLNKSRIAVK